MSFAKVSLLVVTGSFLLSSPLMAEPIKTEAVITKVEGNTITAKTMQGPLTVVLSPSTSIAQTSGLMSKKSMDAKSLIPGLIFTVDGDLQGQTVTADNIRFKEKDWRTAVATKAGTMEELSELRNAIIDGQEYVIRQEAAVYFPTGSAVVGATYKQQLKALAEKAPSYGNYRVSILGFADPRGNPQANERLSAKRALAVSNYLRQTGYIQPGRVLSPSAMGEGTTAPGEAAPSGNDSARRVLVRIVTPKAQLTR